MLGADAIVQGTITNTIVGPQGGHFILSIESVIAGPISTSEVEVEKFQDWTCAQRWAPYARGQRVLLFLGKSQKGGWYILSAGGEGEMPIVDRHVFTSYSELALHPPSKHAVHGGTHYGSQIELATLLNALAAARSCFSAKQSNDEYRRVESVRLVCDAKAKSAAEKSPLTAKLFTALARD